MSPRSAGVRRRSAQTTFAFLGTLAAVAVSLPGSASAGLLHSNYDIKVTGHVVSGADQSVEQYAATNVPLELVNHYDLPNTVSPTPAPPFTSTAARVNRVTATAVGEVASPPSGFNIEFWVKGPIADSENVFVNPLDPTKLVEVELKLVLDTLEFGDKMVLNDVNLVKGILFDAVSVETSGTGFAGDAMHPADPLVALVKYDPDDVLQAGGSFLKIQFDYDTMVVPEPATVALVGIGCLGVIGFIRRRCLK